MSNELLTRIEQLEAENRRLRERENDSTKTLHALIRKLPAACVAVVGPDLDVLLANEPFIRMAGFRGTELAESAPALAGISLNEVFPEHLCPIVTSTHRSGEDAEREDVMLNESPYVLSVFCIRRGELTIVLLRHMADPAVRAEELVARLNQTVDRNIQMIQQVAFLLGEEVSENAKVIGSVIEALQIPTTKK